MPTTITSAGITFNDTTSLTSANIGTAQLVNGSVIASKLGTTEQTRIAKAWVNFNGTTSPGTIRSSYNVSSVTKNGTGDYIINFTTTLADANYSVVGMASQAGSLSINAASANAIAERMNPGSTYALKSASQVEIVTPNNDGDTLQDSFSCNIAVFGN